jgi:TatD DNase family protein
MLIDSHCHFHLIPGFPDNFEALYKNAVSQNVGHFLNVAVTIEEHDTLVKLAEKKNIWISAGMHPNEAPGEPVDRARLLKQASHPKVIAIGETGLDYYRQDEQGDLTWQHDRFREHIRIAKQIKKPLIIHTRMAQADTLKIMREENAGEIGGIMHCFTEDWAMAKEALDLGFYISFSGIVSFKSATNVHEVARSVPADRYLIETDCPYLAPVPYRGKTNEPAFVHYVAEALAACRGVSFDTVAKESTENFLRLFNQAEGL